MSYGLIVLFVNDGDERLRLPALIVSRLIVGLVKQTMTVTTLIVTSVTSEETRAKHMGRLTAASTVAWIGDPSAGALIFSLHR